MDVMFQPRPYLVPSPASTIGLYIRASEAGLTSVAPLAPTPLFRNSCTHVAMSRTVELTSAAGPMLVKSFSASSLPSS